MEELEKLKKIMQECDTDDTELFQINFSLCMELLDAEDGEMCGYFGVSRPTVNRWKRGITHPHPVMIEFVYEDLVKLIDIQLDMGKK